MTRTWMPAGGLWPPDWSQFLPDIVVAGVTGVLVGLAVLWVENRRSGAQDVADAQQARQLVTQAVSGTLEDSIASTYARAGLVPESKALSSAQSAVEALTPVPRPRVVDPPSMLFLRIMVEALRAMELDAETVESRLAPHDLGGWVRTKVIQWFVSFAVNPRRPWTPEIEGVEPAELTGVSDDADLQRAVRDWAHQARRAELAREAFNLVDSTWRADLWPITLGEIRGAPHWFGKRWWRARRAKRQRRDATEKAMNAGYVHMAKGGSVVEPWGW